VIATIVTVIVYHHHSVVKTGMYENRVLNGLMEYIPIVPEGDNFLCDCLQGFIKTMVTRRCRARED
jgi:hypothetical protein